MDTRIEWIDIAKGIGIILVIAGHCFYLGYSYPLYAFHMPLFFFLSGLLFRDKCEGFGGFLKSKTKAIIRPWFIMLLISACVCVLIPQWRNEISLQSVMTDLYTANTNVFQNSSLWYLVCFFFVLFFFYYTRKLSKGIWGIVLLIIVAIASLWIKELLELTILPFHRLPFKIDSAVIALVFFTTAYYLKKEVIGYNLGKYSVFFVILFVAISAVLCAFNKWSNINSLEFGRIRLLYYPIAFMGIASVCLVSKLLSSWHWRPINSILVFYGKNSLLIFGFQSLLIRLYLLLFNNIQGLDMQLYGNNPLLHQFCSFFIVSFVLSPLVVYLFVILRKHNLKVL